MAMSLITAVKRRFPHLPKILFFAVLVKPLVLFWLGLNVRGKQKLPHQQAIIAANHNSHLDTLVLMSLYPLSQIHRVRPVAAADYFFKTPLMTWFSKNCIGVIGLKREGFNRPEKLFAECHKALDNGDILIIFPEGSRGKPEQIGTIKRGLYHLLKNHAQRLPVYPVILRELGKALPRGEALFVPFNCDVVIGDTLFADGSCEDFLAQIYETYAQLSALCLTK